MTGDTPDWGSVQTSLDTPQSELSLLKIHKNDHIYKEIVRQLRYLTDLPYLTIMCLDENTFKLFLYKLIKDKKQNINGDNSDWGSVQAG